MDSRSASDRVRPTRTHLLAPLAAATLAGIAYALTATPWIVGADNAEFVTLSVAHGSAHPPGYPLYTAYLRLMSFLPAASAAHSAALATATLAALAVATLTDALRRWGFTALTATGAALVFAFDANVWNVSAHAEVFALNNLVAAGIFWAAAPDASRRGISRAATLGFLAGLGLSNHHSIIWLAPVGIYGMWLALREAEARVAPIAFALVAGALGLLPYAYLVVTASDCLDCLRWGNPADVTQLWQTFTRAEYGTTSLGAGGQRLPLQNVLALGRGLWIGTSGIAVLGGVVGVFAWLRSGRSRSALLALTSTAVLAGPLFASLFNIAPEGIGAEIVARFYPLAVLTLTPLLAAALAVRPRTIVPLAVAFVFVVSLARVGDLHTSAIDDYIHDLLTSAPEDAVLIGTGDHRMFGVHHHQQVLGLRRDVVYVDARLLAHDWYRERMEKRLGLALPATDTEGIPILEILAALIRADVRPVAVTHPFLEEIRRIPTYPMGVVVRLDRQRPPSPSQLAAMNAEMFADFRMQLAPVEVRSAWEREVFDHYRRTWESLAVALERSGDPAGAEQARTFAAQFGTGE